MDQESFDDALGIFDVPGTPMCGVRPSVLWRQRETQLAQFIVLLRVPYRARRHHGLGSDDTVPHPRTPCLIPTVEDAAAATLRRD